MVVSNRNLLFQVVKGSMFRGELLVSGRVIVNLNQSLGSWIEEKILWGSGGFGWRGIPFRFIHPSSGNSSVTASAPHFWGTKITSFHTCWDEESPCVIRVSNGFNSQSTRNSGPAAPQHCEEGSNGKGGTFSPTGFLCKIFQFLTGFFGGKNTITTLGCLGRKANLGNFRDAKTLPRNQKIRPRSGQGRSSTNRLRHDTPIRHRPGSLQRGQAETMKEYNRLLDEQEEQRAHELAARMERFLGKSKQNPWRVRRWHFRCLGIRSRLARKWWDTSTSSTLLAYITFLIRS